MSDRFEADMMKDMLSDGGEGPAQSGFDAGEDGADQWDAGDEADEFSAGGGRPEARAYAADDFDDTADDAYDDLFAGFDDVDAASGESDALSFEDAVADALEEDDADEFMRRLRRIARGAQAVGRRVGQVARVAAPILRHIPLPQAQALSRIASVAGRLLADGADEFEAIDQLVDEYDDDAIDAAAPLIAGMTLRRTMPQVARMPVAARRQLVRGVTQATRALVRQQGAPAARATARILQTAQRAVRARQMPQRGVPRAVRRAVQRVAQTPNALQRLARPLTTAGRRGATSRAGAYPYAGPGTRRIVLRGAGTVTIIISNR
ncbi:hypothetical protein [Massilia sp. S19_KUP03_FR1]|uniref:hypothetical protein n=1 Tax=Massilia sp. S19_KUP03_FR1 TaxID=3025503 RepID=UPI002FCDD5CB